MANHIDVEIDELAISASDENKRLVTIAVDTILKIEGYSGDQRAQVTVLLTGDDRLKRLNRDFAGEDHVTDVLSFGVDKVDDFPDPEIEVAHGVRLGEIAISLPQTRRQAVAKGVKFETEIAMLAIHGTLHLLGYDHAELDEEREMFGKTDDALAEVFSANI